MLIEFSNDDQAHLDWLQAHPDGYVVNTERGYSPHYMDGVAPSNLYLD